MDAAMNVRLGAKTKEFNTKMGQAARTLKKFGKNMQNLGRTMTTSMTLPLVAAGGASIKLSLDFQKSMTKIQTLVGKSSEDIKTMSNDVLAMSGDVAKSPVELAEGLYFLESAGLRGANAMDTLESVAKGSASGLGEMEALSVVAAAAQNAYGEETLSASDALDKFGVMVRTGMFDAQELSNVLGRQLGLASNLGISFDEVGALISTYTATTGDATSATNGLSAIMMTFAKLEAEPTKQQAEALDALGMSASDVKEMMAEKGLMGTLQHLQAGFDENGIAMAQFFGKSQALKGVLGVLGTQTETYEQNLKSMADSTNFVNKAFSQTAETDAFKMEKAMNQLKVAGTQMGNTLAPVVQALAKKIGDLAKWFGGLDEQQRKNIAKFAGLVAIMGPALMLIGKLTTGIGGFIGFLKKYNVATKVATGAQKLFNLVMSMNPLGVIITIIGAVIAAFVYFATSTSNMAIKVRNFFKKMMNGVIGAINSMIEGVNKYSKHLGVKLPTIKKFTMENEKSAEVVDKNADAVDKLAKNVKKMPDMPAINLDMGNVDTGGDEEEEDITPKVDDKTLEDNEDKIKQSQENIRRMKQQFNVLNTEDDKKAAQLRLENERQNALLAVGEHENAQAEKDMINKLYDKKHEELVKKQTKDQEKSADDTKTAWEETYDSLKSGWQQVSSVANQIMNGISSTLDAINEKETIQMENKHARENEDYELWYARELQRIEDTAMTEEEKNARIEELDKVAADKETKLEKKQAAEKSKIARKQAKQDKAFKIMSAVMGTASAVVQALSVAPPLGFVLAGIVAGMGAAQIATIASTPIPAMAEGGIAFGPTTAIVGEYAGATANPEVIAPLNKLKDMIGDNAQKVIVEGKIKGNDIFLTNDLAATDRLRFT